MSDRNGTDVLEIYPYHLVQFVNVGRKPKVKKIDIVATKWLSYDCTKKKCNVKYPPPPYNEDFPGMYDDMLIALDDAPENWISYVITIKGKAKTLKEAYMKCDELKEKESTLTVESEEDISMAEKKATDEIPRSRLQAVSASMKAKVFNSTINTIEYKEHNEDFNLPKRKVSMQQYSPTNILSKTVNSKELHERIAGGTKANEGEFPYQALFALDAGAHCGGALISRIHVLTSAHCFIPIFKEETFLHMAVILGSIHLFQGHSYAIRRISVFKGYTMNPEMPFLHDIGIIHLAVPAMLSASVAPIGLPPANIELPDGSPTILTGFGGHILNGPMAPMLKKMLIRIINHDKCKEFYKLSTFKSPVVCASFGPGFGSCSGDSGGPLVDIRRRTILGILSGGAGDCRNGIADIYTLVSPYISYIYEEMNYDPFNPYSWSSHPGLNFYQFIPAPLPLQKLLRLPHHFYHIPF